MNDDEFSVMSQGTGLKDDNKSESLY